MTKAYRVLIGHTEVHPAFKWIWRSSCQYKHKVFFWILLKDRLSTRELLRRKNMDLPSYDCVLCTQPPTEETLEHLFFKCDFAQACWFSLNLSIDTDDELFITLEHFKHQLGVNFYMEIIILMSWCIWVSRNDHIFQGIQPSISNCRYFSKKSSLWLSIERRKNISLL